MTENVSKVVNAIQKFTPEERREFAEVLAKMEPHAVDELMEDLHDIRILKERENEPTRSYDEFSKELKDSRKA